MENFTMNETDLANIAVKCIVQGTEGRKLV